VVTSTTHKTLRGPRGGFILCRGEFGKSIDAAVFPGAQGGPLMHVIAAKAIAFYEAMQPDFVNYQQRVVENAKTLASELQKLRFHIVTGGTDNHLLLIDLRPTGLTGKFAEEVLDSVGISANRNSIPFDPLPPQSASGLRLGTPAVTTRGLGLREMRQIASLIHKVLANPRDEKIKRTASQEVAELTRRFPLP
jgi:glycine hydroxymethyltransferase